MEYGTSLTALKKELSPNEQEEFGVRFCIRMVSDVSNVVPVETDLEMILDDRVTSDFYQQTINVTSNLYCLNITLKLTVREALTLQTCSIQSLDLLTE